MAKQLIYLKNILWVAILMYSLFLVTRYVMNPPGDYLTPLFPYESSMWSVWHLFVFFLFGYYSPNYWYISLSLGMAWEFSEYVIDETGLIEILLGNNRNITLYRGNDFMINSLGLILGYFCRTVIK